MAQGTLPAHRIGERPLACVNPLTWTLGGEAAASANLGSLPGARPGAARAGGTRAHRRTLHRNAAGDRDPLGQRRGFGNPLTLFGSYHILDYNLFYANLRLNAQQRVLAYQAQHGVGQAGRRPTGYPGVG
ncbi:MAG TPA: hypothetical protein VGI91_01045 [Steroidobacteraceae bacterium]